MIIDVAGYYEPASTTAGLYMGIPEQRICDTRSSAPANECTGKETSAGRVLTFQLAGQGGLPASGLEAAVVDITAIDSPGFGHPALAPASVPRPETSNLNFGAGEVVENSVLMPVDSSGNVAIYVANGTPEITVDVSGYFTSLGSSGAEGAEFAPLANPERVCDTRTAEAVNPCTGKAIGPGQTLTVAVARIGDVPADATAAVLNITAVGSTSGGFVNVFPAGQSLPATSDVNVAPGEAVAGMSIATVGTNGSVSIHNSGGSTNVVVDIVGWYS
ncbi:MAG: hypothetical protein M0020_09560 [Actinomycetota bacterium]|nr:hypothetical protein [Actinomycetota bacterium]